MIKADCHTHTNFSSDGKDSPKAMLERAAALNLDYIAVTDHMDLDGGTAPDLDLYTAAVTALKNEYAGKIYVAVGIEAGFCPRVSGKIKAAIDKYDFEYIINSVHNVNGGDVYYPSFYKGKTKKQVYGEYFGAVCDSLDCGYPYHAVGHLGYIARFAPYADKSINADDYPALDKIIEKLIKNDTVLELNTSVYGFDAPFLPPPEILRRYREAGGKYFCFSSDAHAANKLGSNFAAAAKFAKQTGFNAYTVIKGGKKELRGF